ncbi:Breast carcinoma amplified sequence 3 [Mortierella sp. AD010]|nr:Breast carcinoma amplified sequence 3 [Mortierella sp. AD010]
MADQHLYQKQQQQLTQQQLQQQQQQQQGAGVRAEPVFIRDPSALESLSSVLTGVSSYVANTLPTSFSMPARGFATSPSSPGHPTNPTSSYYYPATQGSTNPLLGNQDNLCILTNGDVVLFSAFDWIDSGNNAKNKTSRRFCILLGYADGFQIWDITHPDNIHEITSIRKAENKVSFIKVLPAPRIPPGKVDQFEQYRPLVAIISSSGAGDGTPTPRKLQIYSLATHQMIKQLDFGEWPESDISALGVSERGIAVTLTSPGEITRLVLLSQLTLQPLHPKQTVLNDVAYPGVFDLGSRLLAYVTTSEAPTDSTDFKNGEHEAESGGGYQDLAKGVAKEVFGGVKLLGGFAHQTISSYWSSNSGTGTTASTSPPTQPTANRSPNKYGRRSSASMDHVDRVSTHASHRRRHDDISPHKREAFGTVIIRDISLSNMPIIAHFKPHDHTITGCKFSPSGRLLLSVSRHGNVFHVHEVRPVSGSGSRHMYKLARGITHANVEDIVFNEDETWVAVTTSRGTTHLYAINPFGGSPDVGAHMYTGVVNWTATAIEYPTSLNALCRIKQRHHVPEIILSAESGLEDSVEFSPEKHRSSVNRQNSEDSLSSTETGNSDQNQGYLNRLQQLSLSSGGRHRAMIAAYFLPSSTVFASDPGTRALSQEGYEDISDGAYEVARGDSPSSHISQANSSSLLINRSKAPPVSTAAKLQSKASSLWQTLSPPAAAVVQHAAHGLASLPGLVAETSRRGPVATVRSRTMSWTGTNNAPPAKQRDARGDSGPDAQKNSANNDSEVPLAVQQQLASQGSLSEPERGPRFADIYVFNPLGMLTLHRCWISSVRSKKTFNGRVVETSDLVLAPEDVVEWTLNRAGDWATVKKSLAPLAGQKALQQPKFKKSWRAQGEISTYDTGMNSGWKGHYPLLSQTIAANGTTTSTVTLTQRQHLLWKSPQFTFQTYVKPLSSIQQDFAEGRIPETRTLNLRQGVSIVSGRNRRSVGSSRYGSKGWAPGNDVSDGGSGHGRNESHDSDVEGLTENISVALAENLRLDSSSPINQSRMSPSIGSVSPSHPSSYRAATLSFEDAFLISSGNTSGSPKQSFFGSINQQPHYTQHTFLSTPPTEHTIKGKSGSLSGTSPGSSVGPPPLPTFTNISSSSASPRLSSFGESTSVLNGTTRQSPHHIKQAQGYPVNANLSPSNGLSKSIPLERSPQSLAPVNPMAQSTMMMFSPDGDNEVDMPISASILISADDHHHVQGHYNGTSPANSDKRASQISNGSSTLPHGGVFHLDDDFDEPVPVVDGQQKLVEVTSNGRYDSVLGRGQSVSPANGKHSGFKEYLEHEGENIIEDDYDGSFN